MKNLIKKIDSLYNNSHMTYRYQVSYYADLVAMLFLNIVGLIWISAPVAFIITIIFNTPVEQYSMSMINHDTFYGICLFLFFYYGLSGIFFIHNRSKLCFRLQIFGCSAMGLAVIGMISEIAYHFVRLNLKIILNPSEHESIIYLDLVILSVIIIFAIVTSPKLKSILDRIFSPYRG